MSIRIGIGLGLIPTAARPAATTAPVNVVKPFFEGPLTQGQSAAVNPGSWTGLPSPNFTYVIKRGATTVSTDPAYVWTSADVAAGAGAMTVAVTATNDIGPTTATSDPVTIAPPLLLGGFPTTALVGSPYSWAPTRTGGNGPFVFYLTGTPQAGFAFDPTDGEIFGTPVASGTASLTIVVVDRDGLTATLGPFNLPVSAVAVSAVTAFEVMGVTSLDPAGSPAYGIDGNGWLARVRVTALSGAVLDPSKFLVTVQDPGFDNTGGVISAGTRTRYLVPTAVLRRQAPNQATQLSLVSAAIAAPTIGQPVDYFLVLPEHIYAGTTIAGVEVAPGFYGAAQAGSVSSVTNSSTWAYQHPLVGFMNQPHERVTGGSYAVELWVQHRHAQNGQGVAGVEFFTTDGTHVSTSVYSTNPALSSIQTREAIAEVFKATVSTTALDQATSTSICTVDAKVYPWLGTAYQLSVDGAAWPTPQPCTPLRFVNDKTGGYGGAIACVKAGASGGTVADNITAARAAPFPTLNAAITAIATWNNTVAGSHTVAHNDYGGATAYLMDNSGVAQGHELTGTVTEAAGTCWIDVRPDPANAARAFYSMSASRRVDGGLFRLRCDVDKTGATGALSCNDTAQGSSKMLSAMDGAVTLTAGATNPWLISAGLIYQRNINYPISGGQNVPALATHGTSGMRCAQAVGITYGDATTTQVVAVVPYMAVGLSGKFALGTPSTTSQSTNDGGIIDNCKLFAVTTTMNILGSAFEISRGFALTQIVAEFTNGVDFGISASGATANVKNVLVFGLTVPHAAGDHTADVGRFNHGYNDVTATRGKTADIVLRNSLSGRFATKSDYFSYYNSGGVLGNVGNAALSYNVDCEGNVMSFNRPVTIDGSEYFRRAIDPLSAVNVGAVPFTDNKAGTSGAAGFGTYSLTGPSNPAFARVASGRAWRKFDMAGVARRNDGTGAAGAYERAV